MTRNIFFRTVGRADFIRKSSRAAASAVNRLIDGVINGCRRKDGCQFVIFNNFYTFRLQPLRIPVRNGNGDRYTRRSHTVFAGNAGAAVLIDLADLRTDRTEFKGTVQVIHNRKNICIMHKIVNTAAF